MDQSSVQQNPRAGDPALRFGMRTRPGFVISNEDYNRWVAARRAVRLAEVAGLPAIDSNLLKPAVDELSATEPELAVRLLLRAFTYDGEPVLKRALSRTRVATMPAELVKTLAGTCERIIEYASRVGVSGAGGRLPFSLDRMRVAMEVLSRLVIRLEPNEVEARFSKALQYYENNGCAGDAYLAGAIRSMLERSWEALPEDRRTGHVIDILGASIVGIEKFTGVSNLYSDPGELLQNEPPRSTRENGDEHQWREIVSLLVRGLEAGGEARRRASRRIVFVAIGKYLSQVEADAVARALWIEISDNHHLPVETSLNDWVFFLLPEPEPGLAEKGFRRKWLVAGGGPGGSTPSPDDVLWQVGLALSSLAKHGRSLDISEDERSYLTEIVSRWLEAPIPRLGPFPFDDPLRATRQAINGLPFIIPKVGLPQSIGDRLFAKLQKLYSESGIPAYEAVTGLAAVLPDRLEDFASWMRVGLASDDREVAESATWGLHCWLKESSASTSRLQAPPEDLVREIGVMIATRRKASLGQALHAAKWIFDEGSREQQNVVRELALQGLEYLCEELRYDRESAHGSDVELPMLRWRSAQLALTMADRGLEDNSTVARWLAIVEKDPLPEVRHAKGPMSVRQPENGSIGSDKPDTGR